MSELSVIRKFVDSKINRFVVGQVGETFRNQRTDHRNHFIDVALIGCGRIFVGAFDPQHIRVLEEGVLELLRKFGERNTRLMRAANRFVIHVGDIHHALNLESARFEMALE